MEKYKILTSTSPEQLSNRVNEYIQLGWTVVGGHNVVEIHRQNKFRGTQHVETQIQSEYSQTITKD